MLSTSSSPAASASYSTEMPLSRSIVRERRLLVAAAIHPLRARLRLADRPRDAVIGDVGEKAALDERPRVLPEQAPVARVGQEQPLLERA